MDGITLASKLLKVAKALIADETVSDTPEKSNIQYNLDWYKKLLELEPKKSDYIGRKKETKTAFEFNTEEELKIYLKDHPDADKTKHWVKENKKFLKKQPTILPDNKNVKKLTKNTMEYNNIAGQIDKSFHDSDRRFIAGLALGDIYRRTFNFKGKEYPHMGIFAKSPDKKVIGVCSTAYKEHNNRQWLKINCIASADDTQGVGVELMAIAIKKQAKAGMGVELRATPEAEGFYDHIGMHLDDNFADFKEDLSDIDDATLARFFFTADEAQKFADAVLKDAEAWKKELGIKSGNSFESAKHEEPKKEESQKPEEPKKEKVQKPEEPKKEEVQKPEKPKPKKIFITKKTVQPVSVEKVQNILQVHKLTSDSDELKELAGFKSTLGQRIPEKDIGKYYARNASKLKADFLRNMDLLNYASPKAFSQAKARIAEMPVSDFAKIIAAILADEEE